MTLTGHSLGSGLAGLVAGIYNRPGYFVDPMPFGSAVNQYFTWQAAIAPSAEAQAFLALVRNGNAVWQRQTATQFRGSYIPTDGWPNSNWLASIRAIPGFDAGAPLNPLGFGASQLTKTERNAVGQAHDGALNVMRLFGEEYLSVNSDWIYATNNFVSALFDEDLAKVLGTA